VLCALLFEAVMARIDAKEARAELKVAELKAAKMSPLKAKPDPRLEAMLEQEKVPTYLGRRKVAPCSTIGGRVANSSSMVLGAAVSPSFFLWFSCTFNSRVLRLKWAACHVSYQRLLPIPTPAPYVPVLRSSSSLAHLLLLTGFPIFLSFFFSRSAARSPSLPRSFLSSRSALH
jgi:hypothetical protein